VALADETLVLGEQSTLKVAFASIVSTGSSMTLQGGEGGSSAVNSVFVDFSNNAQSSVLRKSWNVGFYCGDEFAVILNNTTSSTAKEANIEINAVVSSTDSVSYATSLALTSTASALSLVDDWSGDLSKTIIKEGKVYVVNLGESQKPLYKVKVSKKDNNTYTLQYAKINESNVTSFDIVKSTDHHFVYVSFAEGKVVSVAPQKTKWDIVWSRSIYKTVSNDITIPYSFPDLVLTNSRSGVQVAEVVSASSDENISLYNSFTLANAQVITTFNSQVDAIGSKWRNGGGPNVAPSIKTDRFYVVKDAAGNFYKLQFVSMGDVRGYPQIKYALLK
jgi:GGDEF domain-containing protein